VGHAGGARAAREDLGDHRVVARRNHVTGSGWSGITVSTNFSHCTNNIIVKNFVSGNGPNNYLTPGNQVVGPLITTYGTITNSNPWANFSY
jgi:hypothetical protein